MISIQESDRQQTVTSENPIQKLAFGYRGCKLSGTAEVVAAKQKFSLNKSGIKT